MTHTAAGLVLTGSKGHLGRVYVKGMVRAGGHNLSRGLLAQSQEAEAQDSMNQT